ncbi:hypothetical protein GCM10023149_11870 [Mucilaginibacter gynuensis]|uniref:Carboxypeptidase-like regulatory domain-containing protein n=2 Tax=Mucilaginibacter gynuensis TaxID=1302236 RepID=A0ABP8G1E1_9SPHI
MKLLSGEIKDHLTMQPVPYASVALLNADKSCNAEEDGIFMLYSTNVNLTDSLLITCTGYMPHKLAVGDFVSNWIILLHPWPKPKRIALAAKTQTTEKALLNPITDEVLQFTGLDKPVERFTYLQVAQKLEAPVEKTQLKSIRIGRMRIKSLEFAQQTKFLVHIYDVDPDTGGPGVELSDTTIMVTNKSSEEITVKPPLPVLIPGKAFYVSVEWLRIGYNVCKLKIPTFKNDDPFVYDDTYTPYIGIQPKKGTKLNMWALTYHNIWKPYTYFSPDYTDLAISAEIVY